jgi:aerobic carbon-monoxide dehydrogenase large subunit
MEAATVDGEAKARMVDDDERLLRGAGRFIDDRAPAGALRLAVLRAPFAHGRITRLETAVAAARIGMARS